MHGEYHHVINRGNVRATLFFRAEDYQTFIRLLAAAADKYPIGLVGYCIMPNHWHLLLRPASQPDMSRALHWMTSLHANQWSREHGRQGLGHVYQSRFLSVPVQAGLSLSRVLRYVERNASAAGLASRAEAWPWGSAYQRLIGGQLPTLLPQPFLPEPEWRTFLNMTDRIRTFETRFGGICQLAARNGLKLGVLKWV